MGRSPLELVGGRFKANKKMYFLKQHVVNLWFSLPQEVLEADSVARFKRGLDKLMNERFMTRC